MALEHIRRIVDVAGGKDASRGFTRVNDLLQHGWTLIGFYVDYEIDGKKRREVPHYVLASDTQEPIDLCQLGMETREAMMQQLTEKMREALGWLKMREEERDRLLKGMTEAIMQGGTAAMALALMIATAIANLRVESE